MMNRMAFNSYQSMNIVHKTKQGNQLWLGDYYAASNTNLLKQKNIRSVLTSAAMLGLSYPKEHDIHHKVINAFDMPSYRMTPHFEEAFTFINESLKRGNVLVHCAAGISRSTTFVLVYLMRAENMPFQQALGYVRSKRSVICPNYGFQNQLKKYEFTLRKNNNIAKNESQSKYDSGAEKKAVFQFLSEDKKRPLKAQQKFSATTGSNRSYLAQKNLSNKTGDYNAFLRGKSVNYSHKQKAAGLSPDYRTNASKLTRGFLSYKLQNPKIITIKK